ncbi:MAG: hypothetical protein RLZZ398_229 [Verrucomicrobiota bacterium]|jgi:hypothetical protein
MNPKSIRSVTQILLKPTLTLSAVLLVGACASMTKAPSTVPAATVRVNMNSVAYYGSAAGGTGTLDFQGERRNFTIKSIGLGGTGGQNIAATGKVYNLKNVSQFPGGYRGISSGFTVIEGKMHSKLTNDKGVIIYLSGATEGLASSGGVQNFDIQFND